MRIAVCALWSGLGPVCKAATVANELRARRHAVTAFMARSQAEVAGSAFDEVVIGDPGRSAGLRDWLMETRPDVMVSFAARVPLEVGQGLGLTTVMVESVGWRLVEEGMSALRAACERAEAVCLQRLGDWPGTGLTNERLVEAIVDRPELKVEGWDGARTVLVHLGGIRRQGRLDDETRRWLIGLGKQLNGAEIGPDVRLVVAGGGEGLRTLRGAQGALVGQLSRKEYLAELGRAEALVTVGGLTGIIEAYVGGVPVITFPSAKREHGTNLEKLAEYGMLGRPPAGSLGEALEWALGASKEERAQVVAWQNAIIEEWGTRGAAQVADVIEEVGRG